jgi:hypothetical protein
MLQQMGVLQNLNNVPVDMTLSGLGALQNAQQADQMTLDNQARQLAFNQVNDPLALEAASLSNQTAQARLPGIFADNQAKQRQNKISEMFHQEEIASLRRKYKDEEIQSYIKGLQGAGEVMRNAAELVFQNPLGGNLRARQMMEQAGAGQLWTPEFDTMRPDQLAQKLHEMGKAFQENGSKYSQALDTTAMKADSAAAIAEANRRAAAERQEARLAAQREGQQARTEAAQKLAEWKAKNKDVRDPRSYEELASRYARLRAEADTMEEIEKYRQLEDEAAARALQLRTEAARINAGNNLDLGALNNPNIQPRNPAPAVPTGPRAPTPAASAPNRLDLFQVIK